MIPEPVEGEQRHLAGDYVLILYPHHPIPVAFYRPTQSPCAVRLNRNANMPWIVTRHFSDPHKMITEDVQCRNIS